MKRFLDWQVFVGLILVGLSIVFYFIHYWLFRDLHHIVLYLIGDIAFLFLDVLIVMLVLHRLLAYREGKMVHKKLDVIISVFFSEVGTELLKKMSRSDPDLPGIGQQMAAIKGWDTREYQQAKRAVERYDGEPRAGSDELREMREFLTGKRLFLLRLLENPNMLDHEDFTNLLWAVFHLTDELAHRRDIDRLPDNDLQHLRNDIKRVYQRLILQWLDYMKYLAADYPYLFSLAVRTNPFDLKASVEVN